MIQAGRGNCGSKFLEQARGNVMAGETITPESQVAFLPLRQLEMRKNLMKRNTEMKIFDRLNR